VSPADSFQAGARLENRSEPEALYRANAYRLLAAVLRQPPDRDVLGYLAGFDNGAASAAGDGPDGLAASMVLLGLTARHSDPPVLEDEFNALFIGLGRGELVPFGSWYLTGYLMEKPLGVLRQDLARLGFEREAGVHEPEDHAAALCEVMALLIEEPTDPAAQAGFFATHIDSWMPAFFEDMACASSAVFYQSVARFGAAFLQFENRYFRIESQGPAWQGS